MKHYKYHLLLLAVVLLAGKFSTAQTNAAQIKGKVFNPDREPSQYSTIVLMNKDSVFITGTLSEADGGYLFKDLAPAIYHITVRNVEFQTHVSDPINLLNNSSVELDDIRLKTKIAGLAEVLIKGERAMVEVHPDKMVFNVANSVNASGNNGLELLSKAPGVIVDLDNNIILQGKSGVQIFINGRPSRLSGSDLTNLLEGMRSDNIEAIDIITNPSAKYEAEGSGGIINIKLKKNVQLGFNGNLIGSYSKGTFERQSLGTNLNFSADKLNVYTSINVSDDEYQDDFVQTTLREDFLLDFNSKELTNRKGLNLSAAADYSLDDVNMLSVDLRALINDRTSTLRSNTYIIDVDDVLDTELLYSRVLADMPSYNYNMNLHYGYNPDNGSSLSADLSYGNYSNTKDTQQPNTYFDAEGISVLRTVNSEYNSGTDIEMVSAMVDYEQSFNKTSISTGVKYSYISTDNQLAFYNLPNGEPVFDNTRSNDFSYLEKIAAAYFIFSASPTDRWSLNAGLRVENTSSLGDLDSDIPTADDVVARNYTSWFPNASLSYNDKKNHAFSIGYGRRISRPNYQDLNPFESKLSELSSWQGNPFLNPNYITNYQLTYSFKRKLVISNTYSITRDFFANIFETVDDKTSRIIPRNMQKVSDNGLSVSYPLKVNDWWEFSSFLIYNYETYDGDINGTVIDLEAHIASLRVQNNVKLPWDISMELSYYGVSPWIWRGTINVEDFHRVSMGFKREFLNKKLLLQVNANDLFRTSSSFYYKSNYGGMIINGHRTFDNQRVGFSATYKFGNQQEKSNRRKKSAIDEELKRIAD